MPRKRFTEEQIAFALRQADAGTAIDLSRQMPIGRRSETGCRLMARNRWAAVLPALLLACPLAAAEDHRRPTGWSLLSPCADNCALSVYGGSHVEDAMQDVLVLEPALPTQWRYAEGDSLLAVAFSRHAGAWGPFDLEPEIGLARRFGRQSVTEAWAALYLRYHLPGAGFLRTSLAVSTGVNLVSSYSGVEIERTGETSGYRLMHFFSPEITIALPSRPEVELLFRFHHRSGAFGLINDVGGGAQYGTVGLRFRF